MSSERGRTGLERTLERILGKKFKSFFQTRKFFVFKSFKTTKNISKISFLKIQETIFIPKFTATIPQQ
jgi:hypothetical protein